ncbi:hypothetical protein CEXT_595541 [Caerostris extrusa]|uniref:Uncharacterized protein n=1 Tax=Caerostris extrusa TaxID=172846 RepID=A0AAV4Y2C4_CAEEX|nr:hypothetical protein CEXT_595541 [Caerostris extrusa]
MNSTTAREKKRSIRTKERLPITADVEAADIQLSPSDFYNRNSPQIVAESSPSLSTYFCSTDLRTSTPHSMNKMQKEFKGQFNYWPTSFKDENRFGWVNAVQKTLRSKSRFGQTAFCSMDRAKPMALEQYAV